jgi:hypothetical protein
MLIDRSGGRQAQIRIMPVASRQAVTIRSAHDLAWS